MPYDTNPTAVNGTARGAIAAHRFVRFDDGDSSGLDDNVLQASANSHIAGVGPDYAVVDGDTLPYVIGGVAEVEAGGTITRGQRVKADADGKAVTLADGGTANQNVGGIARRSAVSGDIFPVQVEIQQVAPGDYLS